MVLLQSSSGSPICSLLLPPRSLSFSRNSIFYSKHRFKFPRKSMSILACSAPNALPKTEQEFMEAVAKADGDEENSLPAVRSYENDLGRLTLIGGVAFQQALTAAAADGGGAADEHIASGMPTMVVETVFPGPSDEHSTVSTRLFLSARKVKEKARKLRSTLTADVLSGTTSQNILTMTFRQVVLQQLWSFELVVFSPGTKRNMGDLESPREVPVFFTLSSSDGQVLSMLAEAICKFSLECTESDFLENSLGKTSNNIFQWFHKSKRIDWNGSSVSIYETFEDEIIKNAKDLLEKFNAMKADYRPKKIKNHWWMSSTYSKMEKIGGPEFGSWISEYIPAYRLQIDAAKLKNVKFEGWKRSGDNRWEVLLTHSQMVGLANIIDMYYEDLYTLPNKQLCSGVVADLTNLSKNKRTSLSKLLSVVLAGGLILVSVSVLTQLCWPRINKGRKYPVTHFPVLLSEDDCYHHKFLEENELETLCVSIIKKIKEAFGWPGDILMDRDSGVWIGELPNYLRRNGSMDPVKEIVSNSGEDISMCSIAPNKSEGDASISAQDIASYQVVLSKDGKIIGFQPTSRLAVNHWGGNPLAQELYGGRKLSPGLIEPGLNIPRPDEIVLIELLMSVNPESRFALARAIK
ncbi:PREDICTED: uncharacterized protein LOC104599506 isoform X2 [Nelumbo nucifera]|uniref:Uncharacterized protein n=2 Tax=Nelumbo nucifera TaxID=4432 RepID=A0A822XUA2_NELNU|nr:PREDICTED: uncharacterized protein LOC104599506 isoform X2 [Nelumbo nucifera]DAD22751.1 TPA_asm: hypothetical protein HUJ06_024214 [Nelumbo nucifera]